MNKFKMRSDTLYYSLGGMGCSAGVSAMDFAARVLRSFGRPATCIVVTHENITSNLYTGSNRSFLVGNALFRLGGSAALLTTNPGRFPKTKYLLEHAVRTVTSEYDQAYNCMSNQMDGAGKPGVYLPPLPIIVKISSRAITIQLTRLGTLVLGRLTDRS